MANFSKHAAHFSFLADRTNGRAYATMLRLSLVCNVVLLLPKNCLKNQSVVSNGHVTDDIT